MSRYRGPRLRIVRRLGELPGLTRKSARRAYAPGQHGQNRKKRSEYAIRLEEKQKLRLNYGLTEKQMLRYVRKARRVTGSTGQVLLQLLEMRLDNTVFRLGMAPTISAARQLVSHGHVTINGRVVNIASYQCRPGEEIGVKDKEASRKLVENNLQYPGLANLPNHLEFDKNKLAGKVNGVIEREWVALQVNELLVVEYYSRQA
ncbi:30S ribosomal protein S4 [Cylindrospermopsis raciborskii S07]|uniref:Small ribosomal subunit protein uS4 n=3 Tax=Cylindrospermopsis raciborskii TaxID=77022 RepID=A0A853MAK1_9CYAN|nr:MULTISPECIES: 30S ribosomal protein S4 [Cylindrospermopsis]MBU6345783.1 30S ribosomal protein S4 [Cyanobacteria bacterium REEB494]EFA68361.1 Ribosomal protein S4 [Cylindrospermopsis raciborskii CS-505]KRH95877.1 30S ribosomal protein S4 [Cylindrospermopsis sp. CR12]MBA4444646.1 30S ribosomal protein S4 [Cylindrospermopsis raciborskii CS-506_C]MBA4448865.1 30S ribosomal protein S4 [Cylindrospermopsis raciborskii CS-506_D]